MKESGKLIVIDGTDGCDKATQVQFLVAWLKKSGFAIETLDFPGYGRNIFGKLIEECLAGTRGDWTNTDPRIASVIYANDRLASKSQINAWLNEGKHVVLDRWVSSNQIHQGGKLQDPVERKEFLEWLDQMEYVQLGLPRPDIVLYLDVPLEMTLTLLKARVDDTDASPKRRKTDVHESSPEHLENAKRSARKLLSEESNWHTIQCAPNGTLLSREEIHEMVKAAVMPLIS